MSKPLNIIDLVPKETAFSLSTFPDRTFTLCRWSLRVRAWAMEKYSSEELKEIFSGIKINEIADIAYFMLKEKDFFKTKDDFLDAISSTQDSVNIITALTGSIGIGEPEIKQIQESIDAGKDPVSMDVKKNKKPSKTGAKSLIP